MGKELSRILHLMFVLTEKLDNLLNDDLYFHYDVDVPIIEDCKECIDEQKKKLLEVLPHYIEN